VSAFEGTDVERRRLLSRPKNRVALALGSGGARGYAHIGAIAEIEARGYEIVGVAGTSMGAMVGGLFAANALDEYTDWVLGLNKRDVAALLDVTISAPGTMKAEKVMAKVSSLLGGVRIEDLRIPFTALAADLLAQKEIWFQDGPLDLALRASIAIPGVFTPIVVNGQLLADGGLFNPLPLSPLAAIPADLVIAVSLSGPRQNGHVGHPVSASKNQSWPKQTSEKVVVSEIAKAIKNVPSGLRTIDVLELSVQSMQSLLQRFQVSAYPPDVQIDVPVDSCGVLEFYRARELMEIGRALTAKALDQLAED
jgi:NTE family protein